MARGFNGHPSLMFRLFCFILLAAAGARRWTYRLESADKFPVLPLDKFNLEEYASSERVAPEPRCLPNRGAHDSTEKPNLALLRSL